MSFENIMGKGENSGNQHFLLFPNCFLLFLKQNLNFEPVLSSACVLNFGSVWNFVVGKELNKILGNIAAKSLIATSATVP